MNNKKKYRPHYDVYLKRKIEKKTMYCLQGLIITLRLDLTAAETVHAICHK